MMLLWPPGLMTPAPVAAQAAAAPLLLDTLSATVAGAYALRRLRGAYNGACVRVRRDSDNQEQDIGFVSDLLDTASLLSFVGAANGFVSKWYDQTPAAQHAGQAVAAQQPQIVANSAVLALSNAAARPCMAFDYTRAAGLLVPSFALGGSSFASVSVLSTTGRNSTYPRGLSYTGSTAAQDYSGTASAIFLLINNGAAGYQAGSQKSTVGVPAASPKPAGFAADPSGFGGSAPFQAASVWNAGAHTMTVDGTAGGSAGYGGPLDAAGRLGIGTRYQSNGDTWDGSQAEHIVIAGALSAADQAAVRASQQAFYGTP